MTKRTTTKTETTADTATAELAQAVLDHAKTNYEKAGWDFIIETRSAADIAAELTEAGITTAKAAIAHFAKSAKLLGERRDEARAEGGLPPMGAKAKPAKAPAEPKVKAPALGYRVGSKTEQLITLASRAEGATVAELAAATGNKDVATQLRDACKRAGLACVVRKQEDGASRYFVGAAAAPAPAAPAPTEAPAPAA